MPLVMNIIYEMMYVLLDTGRMGMWRFFINMGIIQIWWTCYHRVSLHRQLNTKHLTLTEAGVQLYTSESDICGRQISTYKVDHGSVRVKIFIIVVDP